MNNPSITTPPPSPAPHYNAEERHEQFQIAIASHPMILEDALEQFIEDERRILDKLRPPQITSFFLDNVKRRVRSLYSPQFSTPDEPTVNPDVHVISPSASQTP